MQSWHKYNNYRKKKKDDGSFVFIITADGEDVEVSAKVYKDYAAFSRKMKYMELDLKSDRALRDTSGKRIKDERGTVLVIAEREVSLEVLIDEGWDCPSSSPTPEEEVLAANKPEIMELRRCVALLTDAEQALIQALFYEGKKIREYAEIIGESKSKVDRLRTKTLGKLRNMILFGG